MSLQALRTAIFQINTNANTFDWNQPYNKNAPSNSGVGTGFVVEGLRRGKEETLICTAYHVVEMGVRIEVVPSDAHYTGPPIEACILTYSQDLDVAVLTIPVAFDWVVPLKMGNSDLLEPSTHVQAAGFPRNRGFQMTFGNVSGRNCSQVQVDAAINPGNSGGPLVVANSLEVVGVVVSTFDPKNTQNMNFASAITEVRVALFGALPPLEQDEIVSVPKCSLNCSIAPISANMKDEMRLEKGGGYVVFVHEDSNACKSGLKEGDILCSVNGVEVNSRCRMRVPWWEFEAQAVQCVLNRQRQGEPIQIEYWRRGEGMQTAQFPLERELNTYRMYAPESEKIEFRVHGGVVVQPLSLNLMMESEHLQMFYGHVFNNPLLRAKSLLVVTYIHPMSPFSTMRTLHEYDIITSVNSVKVQTIEEYDAAWKASDSLVILQTYIGFISTALKKDIDAMEPVLQALAAP